MELYSGKEAEARFFAPPIDANKLPPYLKGRPGSINDATIWAILQAQPKEFDTTLNGRGYFSQELLNQVADKVYAIADRERLPLDFSKAEFRVLTDVDGPLENVGADAIYLIGVPKGFDEAKRVLSARNHEIFYQFADFKSHTATSRDYHLENKRSWARKDSVHVWPAWIESEDARAIEEDYSIKDMPKMKASLRREMLGTFADEIATRLLVKMGVMSMPRDANFNVDRIKQQMRPLILRVLAA